MTTPGGIYSDYLAPERQSLAALRGLTVPLPVQTLTGAQAAPGSSPWGTIQLPSAAFSRLQAVLSITNPGTAATDTLDVLIDASPDGGTTWVNVVHFTQILGNGGARTILARTPNPAAGQVTDVGADQAAGTAAVPFAGNAVRVRTIRAQTSNATFGVALQLIFLP